VALRKLRGKVSNRESKSLDRQNNQYGCGYRESIDEALGTGKLVSKEMHAEQVKFSAPNTASYLLGVMNASNVFLGHSGEIPGYNSSMYYSPGSKAMSISLINRYPSVIEGAADQINFALVETMAQVTESPKKSK